MSYNKTNWVDYQTIISAKALNNIENNLSVAIDDINDMKNRMHICDEDVLGDFISIDNSVETHIKDIQILGNTIQNPDNLSDIKSVGTLTEDGHFKMSILSCGKNLLSSKWELGSISSGNNISSSNQIRTINYIKVKSNVDYVLSGVPNYTIVFYDKNKKHISDTGRQGGTKFTIVENCMYIRFRTYTSDNITDVNLKIQLEEGTVATPYEPHKETKNTILLPCQLEKVGDVADRLYYDEVEKAWCVEKVPKDKLLVGKEGWVKENADLTNTLLFGLDISDIKRVATTSTLANLLCNRFKVKISSSQGTWGTDEEGVSVNPNGRFHIRIAKSKATDLTTFKQWLSRNNTLIKYELVNPQKIVLPLDTQIALNSFANKTHIYTLDTEIEPTIKAKVSKSLGASVQSLNTKTDILKDRIEAIEGLKESQDMQYETDKGYLVCEETQSGVVKDLKIKGKTLVNMSTVCSKKIKSNSVNTNERWLQFNTPFGFKANKTYKIRVEVKNYTGTANLKFRQICMDGSSDFNLNAVIPENPNGVYVIEFMATKDYKDFAFYFDGDTENITTADLSGIVCLEKSDFEMTSGSFEGLKSVGDGTDKIVVSSVGANLFNVESFPLNMNFVNSTLTREGDVITIKGLLTSDKESTTHPGQLDIENSVYLEEGKEYYFSFESDAPKGNVHGEDTVETYWCLDKRYDTYVGVSNPRLWTCTKTGYYYPRFDVNKGDATHKFWNIQVKRSNLSKEYSPYKADKKQLLYLDPQENTWKKPVLREWDTVEKHSDGKYYYHKRSGEVVLNGSENLIFNKTMQDKLQFLLIVPNIKTGEVLCDKFIYSHNAESKECIWVYNNEKIVIHINSSKLETQDVEGFKKWLQANPITVVYQLAEEEIYDIAPINLDAYANKTMVLCNSGSISPNMSFAITSYITNLILSNKERINNLEKDIYGMFKQVLSGDFRALAQTLYPQDFEKKDKSELIM